MAIYPVVGILGVTISDLSWLSGAWQGRVGDDQIEEHWSKPAAGTLMGMFRWMHDGQVRFYELLTIEPQDDHLAMHIKHFDPGLIGWEEKDQVVTLVLVKVSEREAVFYRAGGEQPLWLFYRREAENSLIAFFEHDESGHDPEDEFRFTR